MQKFIIKPLVAVGNINFGMERSEARKILGDYSEYKNRQTDINTADCFAVCQVFYDDNNCVEFIMFHNLNDIELQWEDRIISDMTKDELISFFSERDDNLDIEIGTVSFESNKLGVACYFVKDVYFDAEENEIEFDKVETISFAGENYWLNLD